jgi:hypothetical protein
MRSGAGQLEVEAECLGGCDETRVAGWMRSGAGQLEVEAECLGGCDETRDLGVGGLVV